MLTETVIQVSIDLLVFVEVASRKINSSLRHSSAAYNRRLRAGQSIGSREIHQDWCLSCALVAPLVRFQFPPTLVRQIGRVPHETEEHLLKELPRATLGVEPASR
jgi:hypothetical protein